MDATWLESQRDQFLSQREKRWSMNSQRLEEIVAQLMKPISTDGRRSFDTDLSALLEEYLTEAGLHALEADEADDSAELVAPNFTEIALLLQQSATIYGIKVDFLYRHVLSVSDSLLNGTQESANDSVVPEEPQTPTSSRRKRKASSATEFGRDRAGGQRGRHARVGGAAGRHAHAAAHVPGAGAARGGTRRRAALRLRRREHRPALRFSSRLASARQYLDTAAYVARSRGLG
ncbi:unnamed protein product [Arctia plantaginis]|uniref:Condensin II complex subunit H2 N-terminal domain-containing protein n=1 Tax=Arctia plantaginis TaxID=874455 RepID=A0A8S1B841_ARCPL|nr:unnamed protein product [Arctia plantaginis]